MNQKKICFVWNVQSEKYYEESLRYIKALRVPQGYELQVVEVRKRSYANAYNEALKLTDAKYKVYLQEGTFIINKNFLFDMLHIFQDQTIGMLGVLGAKTIPLNGIWHTAGTKHGCKYNCEADGVHLLQFGDQTTAEAVTVAALDGAVLATQFDVPWREDLFGDAYYYDVAQSLEFKRVGLRTVVASQKKPWILYEHICKDCKEEFEKARMQFLTSYAKEAYPLVSILIPTYNRPDYLKIALESAVNQTYCNIEIVIADNSTNMETKEMMQSYLDRYPNIQYVHNGENIGAKNFEKVLALSNGEYVNYLMDDDIFHVDKINRMMEYFLSCENISLVTSYRQLIDENGTALPDRVATKKIAQETTIFNGVDLARYMMMNGLNVVGEPTTVLARKVDLNGRMGIFLGRPYKILNDMTQWFELLRKGNAVYIPEALSYFREHDGQAQKRLYIKMQCAIDSFNYFTDSFRNGIYLNREEYVLLLRDWYETSSEYTTMHEIFQREEDFAEACWDEFCQCRAQAYELIG